MRLVRRIVGVVVVVLAALAVTPAAALAPASRVIALSDLASVPDSSFTAASLAPLKASDCSTPVTHGSRTPSAAAALRATTSLLAAESSHAAVRTVLRAKGTDTTAGAQSVAVAGVAAGNPGAALAASLAGVQRAPHDATSLSNLSVLLTEVGKPSDGLALAESAAAHAAGDGPFGIDRKALALNNEGFALLALQRYADAAGPLRTAIARAPLLSEARHNLALALLCSGQDAQAVPVYIAAMHRQPDLPTVTIDDATGDGAFAPVPGNLEPRADSVLDLSHGEQAAFPPLTIPATPDDGVASADQLQALSDQRQKESLDLSGQGAARSQQTGVTGGYQLLHISEIEGMYGNWPAQRPDLASELTQLTALRAQMDTMYQQAWLNNVPSVVAGCVAKPTQPEVTQCLTTDCRTAMYSAHQQWLLVATKAEGLAEQLFPALYTYGTAVAANLANPAAHDTVVLDMRSQIWGIYDAQVLTRVASWASAEKLYAECLQPDGTGADETGADTEPPGLACPPQIDALDLHINLGVIKLSIDCESISASTGLPGFVAPFGKVSYKFANAQTTAFVGLKGGIDDIPGFDVGAKGGLYMTWDRSGTPTDVGVRVTASAGTAIPLNLGPSADGKLEYSLAGELL